MNKEVLLNLYQFNLAYASQLVVDVPDELMATVPHLGLENHPAFTLGHLSVAAAMTVRTLGGDYGLPESYDGLFGRKGPGDPRQPTTERAVYPSKTALLNELKRQHGKLEEQIRILSPEEWSKPVKWRYNSYMPTIEDLVYFMCITHENMHLGQLAAWRRAMNLPSALKVL